MAKINAMIHSFNTGEMSFSGMSRVDQQRTRLAAEIQENFLPAVVGRAQLRPGLEYIDAIPSAPLSRMIPFIRSSTETAILLLSQANLRVIIDDAFLTRPAVTAAVTSGTFAAATGWTLAGTGGGTAAVSGGYLKLSCPSRGGEATATQTVTINETGTEHAFRIKVTRGPVRFRAGSTSGASDYISDTILDKGEHSLSFTPTGDVYIKFSSKIEREIWVDECTIESSGVVSFTSAPWTAAQLEDIQFAQSVDIIFIANENWQQRKIERRAERSWSLVYYEANDGPFKLSRDSDVTLTPGATRGNTTLTASSSYFTNDHVGMLFRLTHDKFSANFSLGAEGQYTDAFQVRGVGTDNDFTWVVSGTWVGTLRVYRSYDDYDIGYIYVGATGTGNQSTTVNGSLAYAPGTNYDNITHYYRVGFEEGNYTSGEAVVALTYNGDSGSGVCRVTAVNSATEAEIEILSDFKNSVATKNWLPGEWSEVSGYPSAVTLFDGRLWWGGNDRIWGSESNSYYAFNLDTEGDSGSIQRSVATGGAVQRVRWMLGLQRLIIGTDSSEVSARSSSFDEPLTPTSITLRDASTQGVSSVPPVKYDSRAVYVQRSKQRVYEIVYNFESNDYTSKEVTSLNENVGGAGELTGLVIQRQPEPYIWHIRDDGECPILIYDPGQEVAGYVRFITDGDVEDIVVLPGASEDRIYCIVKRFIGGVAARYIEKLAMFSEARGGATNKMLDSFKFYAGPVQVITDLSHLEGETVRAWGNSTYLGSYTVASGRIELSESATNVCVGLTYTGRYKSAKLAYGARGGTAIAQKKHIRSVGLVLENVHPDGFQSGVTFSKLNPLPRVRSSTQQHIGTSTISQYEEMMTPVGKSGWNVDERFCIKVEAPYPCTLVNLILNVETNETV